MVMTWPEPCHQSQGSLSKNKKIQGCECLDKDVLEDKSDSQNLYTILVASGFPTSIPCYYTSLAFIGLVHTFLESSLPA